MKKFLALIFALSPFLMIIFLWLYIYSLHLLDKILNFGSESIPTLSSEQKDIFELIHIGFVASLANSEAINSKFLAEIIFWSSCGLLLFAIFRILKKFGKDILHFLMNLLKSIYFYIHASIFSGKTDVRAFVMRAYTRLLSMSVRNIDYLSIWKAHIQFFQNINKDSFTNKEKYLISLPFSYKTTMENLYAVIHKITKNDDCISLANPIECSDKYISLSINIWDNKARELKSKILEDKTEFLRVLPWYSDEDSIFELSVKDTGENLKAEFFNKDKYWENQTLDLDNFTLARGELLAGFYPEFVNGVIEYKKYIIHSSDLLHFLVRWSSGSWKDIAYKNLTMSILKNIKEYSNFEMIVLDLKNDFLFLEGLEEYGIYRYSNIVDFEWVLSHLETIMTKRIEDVGMKENAHHYNDSVEESKKIKDIFLAVWELSSVIKNLDKFTKNKFLDKLAVILALWRSSAIHVTILNQSFRKSQDSRISELLINLKDKFILAINEPDEILIAGRWLWSSGINKIKGLSDYTALHVENANILKKYKPYQILKEDLEGYVLRNFKRSFRFKNEKIQKYYQKVLRTWEIGSRESQGEPWNLNPSEWAELKNYLEENKMISQNPNNSFTFLWKKSQ